MGNQSSSFASQALDLRSPSWDPDKTACLPSPWHNFDFHPSTRRDRNRASGFPLLDLPAELLYYVAKYYLPQESVAALSMTCKATFDLLGSQLRNGLNKYEKWNLIILLERDCDLATACPGCLKLHLPFLGGGRACDTTLGLYLPFHLTPSMCRCILRRHAYGQPYSELVSAMSKTNHLVLPDHKQFLSRSLRIAENGGLLIRTEIVLGCISDDGTISSRSAHLLQRIVCGTLPEQLVCRHVGAWVNTIPFRPAESFVPPQWNIYTDDRFATSHHARHHHAGSLSPNHQKGCYNDRPLSTRKLAAAMGDVMECALLHPQPCRRRETGRRRRIQTNDTAKAVGCTSGMSREWGIVRGCAHCCTDFCVNIRDVEGIGRVMVLTSWKDLGGPTPGGRVKWFSHRVDLNFPEGLEALQFRAVTGWDPTKAGSIYCQFEGVASLPEVLREEGDGFVVEPPCYRYDPKPSRTLVRRFTQVPHTEVSWYYTNLFGII